MPADFLEEHMLVKGRKKKSVNPGSPGEQHPLPPAIHSHLFLGPGWEPEGYFMWALLRDTPEALVRGRGQKLQYQSPLLPLLQATSPQTCLSLILPSFV